jgi:hypothetical protein
MAAMTPMPTPNSRSVPASSGKMSKLKIASTTNVSAMATSASATASM